MSLELNNVNVRHGGGTPTDSNAIRERQPMTIYRNKRINYRKIWEDHYGPIPKDEEGRSYEIHHIDGDRTNNDINNLSCMPIKEHYDTHYSQGDWAACHRIAAKMNLSPEILSELSKKNCMNMIEKGTHPFVGGKLHRKLAKEGRHSAQLRSSTGTNLFQNSDWKRQNAFQLIEEGRHASQTKKECPYCNKSFSITGYDRHIKSCNKNPDKTKNKYKPPEKKQCLHCLGFYDPGNYKKYHGENCKKR